MIGCIADSYHKIYQGLEFTNRRGYAYAIEYNEFSLAEYKADFDMALKRLPEYLRSAVKRKISGYSNEIRDSHLLYEAFRRMAAILNGELDP